jgi:hypothetical protein
VRLIFWRRPKVAAKPGMDTLWQSPLDAAQSGGTCPKSADGHHRWDKDQGVCVKCHRLMPGVTPPPCTHSHTLNGKCVECHEPIPRRGA